MVTLEVRLKRIENLPAVPASVAQLLSVLSQAEPDSREIDRHLQADPALSLGALRMANSAFFAGVEPARSIQEAARRLGRRNLLKVVLSHFAQGALSSAGKSYGLAEGEAWRGALAGGLAAELVAESMQNVDPAVAFTAGLLRDCGKLAMDHLVEARELLHKLVLCRRPVDQIEFEQTSFELDHAELGAALACAWGLTEELQQAIHHHHHPPQDPPVPLIDAVYAGEVVSMHMGLGLGFDGFRYELEEAALARVGVDRVRLGETMSLVHEKLLALEQISAPRE